MRKLIITTTVSTVSTESTVVRLGLNTERIAKIVHAMLGAYSTTVGLPSGEDYDDDAKSSTETAVDLVLNTPDITAEALHQAWVQARKNEGWVYGETKDPEAKTHPCLVEWDQLSKEHRIKDEFFISIVRSYANVFGDLAPEWEVKESSVSE